MKFDPHSLLSPKYAQWIITSLILIFSLLIVVELSSLFWNKEPEIPAVLDKKSLTIKASKDNIRDLMDSSIFGVYVPNDLNAQSIQKSMLNVTLVGIILADKVQDSHVIIKSANGEEKNYKIGDTVPGGALIKRITADGVLVERDGIIESITLPKDSLSFEPLSTPLKQEELQ